MLNNTLYIFNPEHDLALASNEENYMPPASARQMASELALLPAWYADEESYVLAPSAYNADYLIKMQEFFGLKVQLLTEPEVKVERELAFSPWGWDNALRRRLLQLGADETKLPTLYYISNLRELSHRRQAVGLLKKLQLNDSFCGQSYYLKTLEDCKAFVEQHDVSLLKAPLSGSGKGLNWCKGLFSPFILGWCNRVIKSQGGVIGEPVYQKVIDFAMEFCCGGNDTVTFAGYSLFKTNRSGMYDGNLLWSNERIQTELTKYVSPDNLILLKEHIEKELTHLLGGSYSGYLGVDMMICRFENENPEYRIHPCVEINMRMNMGVVSRLITDRFLLPGSTGQFQISYFPAQGEALKEHQRMLASLPLCMKEKRISKGYLSLVPVTARSQYHAYILVE